MANSSPHPGSHSPSSKQPSSAFQWPIPPSSPSQSKSILTNDITVKEILDRYSDDPELLKYILTAKSEEDKKKAARDTLRAEEVRIKLRQMDLDLAREQAKTDIVATPIQVLPHPLPPPPPPPSNPAHTYIGLAPVQQQVLARFHYPPNYQPQPPLSPSVPYPHSAHPLCPPSSNDRLQPPSSFRPISPTLASASEEPNIKSVKRNRSSVSLPSEQQEPTDKLSHNKVMEALKAKIQRGNGGPPSPLTASPMARPLQQEVKKRKITLPRPVLIEQPSSSSSSSTTAANTTSPRSAKPILPPIDTTLGRMKTIHPSQHHSNSSSSNHSSSSSSHSSTSSNSSHSHHNNNNNNKHSSSKRSKIETHGSVSSPSDLVLLNTRRARSLSPPSSSSSSTKRD
ncbi:hypothetical protein BD560DRAFT_447716 [Blakeslea trispora]|nr:hypothetical protein BD560DRAFT_447716 [Blakeslea trispora]